MRTKIIWIGLILIGILGLTVEIKFGTINLVSIIISSIFIFLGAWLRKKL